MFEYMKERFGEDVSYILFNGTRTECEMTASSWTFTMERVGYVVLILTICVTGTVLNSTCVIGFWRSSRELAPWLFLFCRSLTDLLTCLLVLPMCLVLCSVCFKQPLFDTDNWRMSYSYWVYIPLANMTTTMSILLTVAVTLSRYILVKRRRVTLKARVHSIMLFVVICIILLSIAINLPYFSMDDLVEDNVLDMFVLTDSTTYTWIRVCLIKYCATIVVGVVNTLLVVELRRTWRRRDVQTMPQSASTHHDTPIGGFNRQMDAAHVRRSSCHEKQRLKKHTRVTVMLIAVSIGFLVAHIPESFAHPRLFKMIFGECSVLSDGYKVYRLVCNILEMLSYVINQLIHSMWSEVFRRALKFTCCYSHCCVNTSVCIHITSYKCHHDRFPSTIFCCQCRRCTCYRYLVNRVFPVQAKKDMSSEEMKDVSAKNQENENNQLDLETVKSDHGQM